MFSGLSGSNKGSRRLLSGSGGDTDKSRGSSPSGTNPDGPQSAAAAGRSRPRLPNPFAASSSQDTRQRSPSPSAGREGSPLRGSLSSNLSKFDPRQLWGGGSASTKNTPGSDQQSGAAAAAAGGGAAAAAGGSSSFGPRRLIGSSTDGVSTATEQPSAATALSSATAARGPPATASGVSPFRTASPPPGLGLLGSSSSSGGAAAQRSPSGAYVPPRSSSRQEQLATLPSEEIEEAWNAIDTETCRMPSSTNPSPEPGLMGWRRGSEAASAASSRSATPSGAPPVSSLPVTGLQRSSSRSRNSNPDYTPPFTPSGVTGVTDPAAAAAAAAAGDTGASTGSSTKGSSMRDRARLVREYVKLRSTPTPTPRESLRGEGSYPLSGRASAAGSVSDAGRASASGPLLGASSSSGAAAGTAAAAGAAGGLSLWRLRSPSPSDMGAQADQGATGLQPSPLMGGAVQPSPLMGGGMAPVQRPYGVLGSPARSNRFSDSSLPPSPVMPESPNRTARVSDASTAELAAAGSSGLRLSALSGSESRLRRKPLAGSTGGSVASSPRAPVGVAQSDFRRRATTEERDEIDAAADRSTGGGLRTISSEVDRSSSYQDRHDAAAGAAAGAAVGAAAGAAAARPALLNPFASRAAAAAGTSAGALGSSTGATAGHASAATASKAGGATAGRAVAGTAAAAGAAAGDAAVSGRPGFLGSLFGIRRKQADVETPPSPRRQPPAAAVAAAAAGASPARSTIKPKQQQQQQPYVSDTTPVSDYYRGDYSDPGYTAAPYSAGDRYDRDHAPDRGGSAAYQRPVMSQKPAVIGKPPKQHHFNWKRLLWAALLMIGLAAVAVGIWAGVTYGRKSGVPAPVYKPSNFTMNLAAGSRNSNGQQENCTDWFSNPTGVEKFRQTVVDAYSKALNLPPSAIKVGDVNCKPSAPQGRHLLSVEPSHYDISTTISILLPTSGTGPGGGEVSQGLIDRVAGKIAAFFGSRGGSSTSSRRGGNSSSGPPPQQQQQQQQQQLVVRNSTSTRLLLQDKPGSNSIISGVTVDLPDDPAAQAEIIKKIESSSSDILSEPLSNLLGVPVAVEQVQHVGQKPLPAAPPPPPPPVRPWRPPVGVLPPTPANVEIIPSSPKPKKRRKRSPSPSPLLPSPSPAPVVPPTAPQVPEAVPGQLPASPSPSPRPRRPRRSPLPSPVVPLPQPEALPQPPPPAPSPPPPPVPPPPPEPLPSPSPRPRRRRRRSPSPSPMPDVSLMPVPAPVVPPPAPLPTQLQPQLPSTVPQLVTDQPGVPAGLGSDTAVQLPMGPGPQEFTALQPPIPATYAPNEPYAQAPTCQRAPTILNSVADGSGRLWGWEKGQSCVFRAVSVSTTQPVSYAATTWQAAPSCTGIPTPQTSVVDDLGRLWGWQYGQSCAYRSVPPLRGTSPAPMVEWEAAPTCMFAPTQQNAVPDSKGRLWGWQNSQSCAFRG